MSTDYKADMEASHEDFQMVWASIGSKGRLLQVEGRQECVCEALDMIAGIDYLVAIDGKLKGVAARVQQQDKSFDTFTIRSERVTSHATELAKRQGVSLGDYQGWLYPWLTIQGYVTKSKPRTLLAAGIVRTRDLMDYAVHHGKVLENTQDGNKFKVITWAELLGAGIKVTIVRPNKISSGGRPRRPPEEIPVDIWGDVVVIPKYM